ncbi:MAG: DUF1444 family protein [Planctomycetota bacterium]|nr:DUF1444 family protein [Planctomycetota bacterium]
MSAPSREKFVHAVLELVGKKFPLVKISRAEQSFSMRVNGHVASLENLYRMSLLRPEDTRRHVERWVVELIRASEGTPDRDGSFDELRQRVMPVLVAEDPGSQYHAVSQPLINGLSVAYALDDDRVISYLTSAHLKRWKVSLDQLHEAALENLLARSQTMSAHAAQDESGRIYLILFQTMDGYDASRLLLPNLHEKLREHLGSPFAAAIPNRDILLCFRNDEETVAKLEPQIESDFAQMPHQVTDGILLVTADGIAPRA